MNRVQTEEQGFTIAELAIGLTVLAIVIVSVFALFISLINSTVVAKQKAVASTLATNQMEYLKSLPYDSLAVAGGSIYSTNPLPASFTNKVNGITYTVTSSVNFTDDAFDGCTNYPNQTLKELYCRSYPPPTGAPAPDTNPQDYKIVHVSVSGPSGFKLAEVDTTISARVAETASTTGALFVNVIDNNGNPISGATVTVQNSTLAPVVNLSDSSDSNGVAIFYGLPPDTTGFDYKITASKSGYSTLATIAPAGSLQPNYPSQNVFTQQSSYVTLTIKPQGTHSLVVETTDTSGSPLTSVKVYVKGGYKKYNATANTAYYYDNLSPSDTRPTSDGSGLLGMNNLVPGDYIFCGDQGATSCTIGGVTYYLAAAVPYTGTNPLYPITVPTYETAPPPSTVFPYGGQDYIQKVRLLLTTNASFPRLNNLSAYDVSLAAGNLSSFSFTLSGFNLPCNASPGSCGTVVRFVQGSNTYTASCTGDASGLQLNCTVNLTGISIGKANLVVIANGNTLTLPGSPLLGGLSVTP